ncbi:Ig-like domain-containing protein, partial [Pseudomonas chlororaphis subsp. aurantiaca]
DHNFTVIVTDPAGNASVESDPYLIIIDTKEPNAPTIDSVIDDMGTVTGDIANGGRTDDTTPTLNGTAEAGSIVRIYNGTTLLGSVQANASTGAWSYTPTALTNGTTYNFQVNATDAAGNTSGYSGSRAVTIDTTPPGAPVITSVMDNEGTVTGDIANGGTTDDTTPTLNGTAEANS